MKKLTGIKINTYDAGNGFRVDIIDDPNDEAYGAYLYRENLSKFAMPGLDKTYAKTHYVKFIEHELNNYKDIYDNNFMRGYRYDGLPEEVEYDPEIHTDTFYLDKDWTVDIVEKEDEFEAWLYRESMGVKSMMFGVPKFQMTDHEIIDTDFRDFLGMVYGQWENYTEAYDEDYY